MAAPEVYNVSQSPITSHAFNADRTQVAVSLNTNEVQLLSRSGADWTPVETLSEHDKIVTSIDWAPNSNRIVTTHRIEMPTYGSKHLTRLQGALSGSRP